MSPKKILRCTPAHLTKLWLFEVRRYDVIYHADVFCLRRWSRRRHRKIVNLGSWIFIVVKKLHAKNELHISYLLYFGSYASIKKCGSLRPLPQSPQILKSPVWVGLKDLVGFCLRFRALRWLVTKCWKQAKTKNTFTLFFRTPRLRSHRGFDRSKQWLSSLSFELNTWL